MSNLNTTRLDGRAALLLCVAGLTLAGGLAGCRGDRSDKPPRQFFPDMDDAPKWKPQSQSEFFADAGAGRTMRPRVQGTIAFSNFPLSGAALADPPAWARPYVAKRADYLKDDEGLYFGTTGGTAGMPSGQAKYLDVMPASVLGEGDRAANARAMLELGRQKFTIYCAVCHGQSGDGKGMVGKQWGGIVANFHDPKYRDRSVDQGKDGYLFHVARNGVAGADGYPSLTDTPEVRLKKQTEMKMPPYGHALNEHDAWAVVMYLRALQEAQLGTIGDVPAAEREALEKKRAAGTDGTRAGAESRLTAGGER